MRVKHLILVLVIASGIGMFSGCQKLDWKDIGHDKKGGKGGLGVFGEKADLAVDWARLQLKFILYSSPQYGNPVSTRLFAYGGISLYESLQPGMPYTVSLSETVNQMPVMPKPEKNKAYSWPLAANAALAFMTRNMLPNLSAASKASIDSLEKAYNDRLKPNSNSEVFARSQAFGLAVAQAVFDWSKSDKFDQANAPYTPPVFPGAWQPTPNAFLPAAVPYVKNCRPFYAGHTGGLTPAFPISYSEVQGTDFYNMEINTGLFL